MTFKQILRQRAQKSIQTKVVKQFSVIDVLVTPVMTEKTFALSGTHNQYVFKVHEWANKNDIKKAIEELYDVPVMSVKTLRAPEKWRANRKLTRRSYKKAIIIIDKKHKLEEPKGQ